MKHILSITVAIIYLLISAGIQINAHFCHGELESVKILVETESCCCGNEEVSGNCCSNENISFQADIDNHLVSESRISFFHYETLFNCICFDVDFKIEAEANGSYLLFAEISPPVKQPVWLLNCSLVYYG